MTDVVTLLGCGDVGPIHGPTEHYASLVRDTLLAADIRFAQVERVYSEARRACSRIPVAATAASRQRWHRCLPIADFTSLVANNHAMDWAGRRCWTRSTCCAIEAFRRSAPGATLPTHGGPLFIDCNGLRVAFLAYCSILHDGYAAGPDKAGIAPLRAHTRYEPVDYQPGVPPRIVTTPDGQDLAALLADVQSAKQAGGQARAVAALGRSFCAAANRRLPEDRGICRL